MEYKLSKAEAKLLVVANQSVVSENYADFLGVKLNMSSSYVAGMIRRLELAEYIHVVNSGKRRLVRSVDTTILEKSKLMLADEKE